MESFTSQQSAIVASLSFIGGFDPRPRIGGQVILDSGLKGIVSKIDTRGKVVVQLQDSNEIKKISFSSVFNSRFVYKLLSLIFVYICQLFVYIFKNSRPVLDEWPFKIETFAQHEDALRVATSLFSLLSQDFKIDKEKWKIVSGMYVK